MSEHDLPNGFKIPRPGSRKHEVWLEYRRAGREAALAKAAMLDIKESSAKAWLGDWKMADRGILPAWMRKGVAIDAAQIRQPAAYGRRPNQAISSGTVNNQTFALEHQLRDFLAWNLSAIMIGEKRLVLYTDAAGRKGIEYPTSTGPIDILAIDQEGSFFVFELKRAKSPDSAIGQVMRYMAWIKENVGQGNEVYGIVVAETITDKLRLAASMVKNILLFEYQASIKLNETK